MLARSTYAPEVVDKQIENAQDDNQHDGAPLGLEADDDHDASHSADHDDQYAPEAPVAREDKADKQKDEQDASGELKVHFAVLFVDLWQSCRGKLLPNPRIRQDHQEPANHGQVPQEEVEVEYQTISDGLSDDDAQKAADCVLAVLANNDES